jgi:hypothetical protein
MFDPFSAQGSGNPPTTSREVPNDHAGNTYTTSLSQSLRHGLGAQAA